MVSKEKVEKKLPALLIDGETTSPTEWNEYQKKRQRLATYKKHHPREYESFTLRATLLLKEIDRALYLDLVEVDKNLSDAVREAFTRKK